NTIRNRALALNGLQTLASVMLRSSNQKFPPAQAGDTVRDFECVFQILIANLWITKISWLFQLYTRNQFAVCKEKLISLNDVLSDKTMSLRQ
ncbi:Uncharacterized protein FWK35_00037420, partial [Aphis craccivora]